MPSGLVGSAPFVAVTATDGPPGMAQLIINYQDPVGCEQVPGRTSAWPDIPRFGHWDARCGEIAWGRDEARPL